MTSGSRLCATFVEGESPRRRIFYPRRTEGVQNEACLPGTVLKLRRVGCRTKQRPQVRVHHETRLRSLARSSYKETVFALFHLTEQVSATDPMAHRRLPPLSASLTPPIPVDNHTEHQGRIRSFPHVEGQYVAYIYVPLVLGRGEALYNLVTEVVCKAREEVEGLWGIGEVKDNESDAVHTSRCTSGCAGECNKTMGNLELHISLSRPILLRAHQREEVKKAVKRIAHSVSSYVRSLIRVFDNVSFLFSPAASVLPLVMSKLIPTSDLMRHLQPSLSSQTMKTRELFLRWKSVLDT